MDSVGRRRPPAAVQVAVVNAERFPSRLWAACGRRRGARDGDVITSSSKSRP